MVEFRKQALLPPAVDVLLLLGALKAGFMLNPGDRPELAMLGAAVIVQLFLGPRAGRFFGPAAAAAAVIFLLYAFFWSRAADAWPLAIWLVLLPVWRSVTGRISTLREWLRRIFQNLLLAGQKLAGWLQAAAAWPGMRHFHVPALVLAGVGLMWPYLTRGIIGAGDANWYANTVADYVVQMRAGIFPVWAAQSDYSFYGSIFPLRLAPYLAHLAGAVDLLTARQLPPYAVMNVSLVVSMTGGMVAMLACLRQIVPGRPWSMFGLALCYGLCPGVLGLAYAQDLYMSVCTLPFLPVAFLGVVRSFTRNDLGARLLMSGALAAVWLAHPPIGLWCGLVLVVTQVVRWFTQDSWRRAWKYDAIAAGLVILLTSYSYVSVRSLGPMMSTQAPASFHWGNIMGAFPANWLPLHPQVRALDNLQLGYGLAGLGVLAAWFGRGSGPRAARVLLGCAAGLIVLLVPIPWSVEYLWRAMPQGLLDITNIWPQQRLLVIAAVCVIVAGAVWLGEVRDQRQSKLFGVVLLAALAWGGWEAAKFIGRGSEMAGGWTQTTALFRPENRPMTKAALGPQLVQPRYFNHGVTDVQLEHRFLSLETKEIIRNATDAIMPGAGPGAGKPVRPLSRQFTGQLHMDLPLLNLEPRLVLEPGKHYLLVLEFLDHDYTGTLKMEGRDFLRVYGLPEAGHERSFGTKPANSRWIALWQTTAQPVEILLRWLPARPAEWTDSGRPFANFELREYDPAALDIVVESLVPYRAAVKAPAACYFEVPRVFVPGYSAVVDGRPAPVEMSPDGILMVRLDPGHHVVELNYTAPLSARLAYWIGLAGWCGLLVFSVRYFRGEAVQRRAS